MHVCVAKTLDRQLLFRCLDLEPCMRYLPALPEKRKLPRPTAVSTSSQNMKREDSSLLTACPEFGFLLDVWYGSATWFGWKQCCLELLFGGFSVSQCPEATDQGLKSLAPSPGSQGQGVLCSTADYPTGCRGGCHLHAGKRDTA